MNDPIYKPLFSFKRLVADLLRAVGHPDWLGEVDFDTLDKLPAEYVGDMWQQRRDTVGGYAGDARPLRPDAAVARSLPTLAALARS